MNPYSRFLTGLVAAPHTPFHVDGQLNPDAIPRQAELLEQNGISGVFICGSTGETHSLTVTERTQVAQAWKRSLTPGQMKLVVHAGHNCLEDAKRLAMHAQEIGADAVAIMAPSYFKPATVDDLVDFCTQVAAVMPKLPFYFYDIPSLTGVNLPMPEFLKHGSKCIPNLAGLKFTNSNFMALQQCLDLEQGRFNILSGFDEMLLVALALGVEGAVGSTYNFAAPIYHKLIAAFRAGDLATARKFQLQSVQLVEILCQYGVLPAGKALMKMVGVDCGPVRPPLRNLTPLELQRLQQQVNSLELSKPVS